MCRYCSGIKRALRLEVIYICPFSSYQDGIFIAITFDKVYRAGHRDKVGQHMEKTHVLNMQIKLYDDETI